MILERFFIPGLSHASYFFSDGRDAAVVDPERDISKYLDAAERHGASIRAVFLTHTHADFVGGHVELEQRCSATMYTSDSLDADYDRTSLSHGDVVRIGALIVEALATPGHTLDSISFLVEGSSLSVVFTGDTIVNRSPGRPEPRYSGDDAQPLSRTLRHSVREILLKLPAATLVLPSHIDPSGAGPAATPDSLVTIGDLRSLHQTASDPPGAPAVGIHPEPPYFQHVLELNRQKPRPLSLLPFPHRMEPAILKTLHEDTVLVDVRPPEAYRSAHLFGSLNVGVDHPSFEVWVGHLVEPDVPIVLIADREDEVLRVRLRLSRIGYENVVGYLLPEPELWTSVAKVVQSRRIDPDLLASRLRSGRPVVDVGESDEAPVEIERGRSRANAPGIDIFTKREVVATGVTPDEIAVGR